MARRLIAATPTGQGAVLMEDAELGRGGEGSVYSLVDHSVEGLPPASELVAKVYHNPLEGDRLPKLKAMLMSPPKSASVAWPLALIFSEQKQFLGYLMVKLPSKTYRSWAELSHAQQRRQTAASFDVRYGITALRNLAVAIASVHQAGHRVGDINESNIFVGADARVLLVDTDSAQVRKQDGSIFPCLVGKPEYTAAELTHGPLKDQERTVASDVFGYAVAAYQMLTGGAHPTDATFQGEGEPPSTVHKIRAGLYPGLGSQLPPGMGHPQRIPTAAIPTELRRALWTALSVDPAQRPTMPQLIKALDGVLPQLTQCPAVKHHWYDKRDGRCGWCTHAQAGQFDPWADRSASDQGLPTQFALPAVDFGDSGSGGPTIRRAAPAVAGQAAAQAQQQAGMPIPVAPQPVQPQAHQQPQQVPGMGQPQQPPSPPSPPEPPKQKGRKTYINYADGTTGPRPPLGLLLRVNPKLGIHCLKEETPKVARFWWPNTRNLAEPKFLAPGLLITFLLAVTWSLGLPQLITSDMGPGWLIEVMKVSCLVAGAGTVLTGLWLTASALMDRHRAKKQAGNLDNFKRESALKTILSYFSIGLIYGPLLVVGGSLFLAVMALNVLVGLMQSGSGFRA